jgi:hypothetical protein
MSRPALGPTQSTIQWLPVALSLSVSGHGVRLATDLHVQLRLRMIGVIPLFPMYAFIACIGTTLPLALTKRPLCSDVIYTREIDLVIFNNSLAILNYSVLV